MGFKHHRVYYRSEVEKPQAQPVVGSVSGEPAFLTTTGQQRIVGGQQRTTTEDRRGTPEGCRDRTTGNRTSVYSYSIWDSQESHNSAKQAGVNSIV